MIFTAEPFETRKKRPHFTAGVAQTYGLSPQRPENASKTAYAGLLGVGLGNF